MQAGLASKDASGLRYMEVRLDLEVYRTSGCNGGLRFFQDQFDLRLAYVQR